MEKPIEYEQTDKRWADILYSVKGSSSQTIGISGCGPTSAAMVIATLRDKSVTPKETSAWALANGYRTANDGTAWSYFPAIMKKYDIPCDQVSSVGKAVAALEKNFMVITAAGRGIWTSGGHVFLAYGLTDSGNRVYINDPNSEAVYRELANISNFKSECVQFWVIEEEWRDEDVEIKKLEIEHKTLGKVAVSAVNVNGENFIRLRDTEKIAPITVGWNGKSPTVEVNYND